jgi:hypothetical protein
MKKTLTMLSLLLLVSCQSTNGGVQSASSTASSMANGNTSSTFHGLAQSRSAVESFDLSSYPVLMSSGSVITDLSHEPISFSAKGMNVTVRKYHQTSLDQQILGYIQAAAECDGNTRDAHYLSVIDLLRNAGETVYDITSNEFPEATTYLMVIPNAMHYQDTAAFLKDLPGCGAGGAFPLIANAEWLVFKQNDCAGGAAFTDRGAKIDDFCTSVFEDQLEPTVRIQ